MVASSESVRFEAGVGGRVLALTADPRWPSPSRSGASSCGSQGLGSRSAIATTPRSRCGSKPSDGGTRVVVEHRGFDRSTSPSIDEDWAGLLGRFADRSRERVLLARLAEFVTAIAENDVDFFRREPHRRRDVHLPGHRWCLRQAADRRGHDGPSAVREVPRSRIHASIDAGPTAAVLTARAVIQRVDDPSPRSVVITSNTFVLRG